MPLLQIISNATIDDNKDLLAKKASQFTAELLGKPESYVMVHISTEQTLFFAGSNQPAALVNLKSLGLPEENTGALSEKLCNFISTEFNIASSRIYIEFSSPERHMWGWDKRTF